MSGLLRAAKAMMIAALALLFSLGGAPAHAAAEPEPQDGVVLTIYEREGCAKCAELNDWLTDFLLDYPQVQVQHLNIAEHSEQMAADGQRLGFKPGSSPTTILENRVWIGYTTQIADDIARNLSLAVAGDPVAEGVYGVAGAGTCDDDLLLCSPGEEPGITITVPVLGEVDLSANSLVVSTLIIGFVDGVNPCSLWVISVLLTIVIRTGSRRRVLAIGSTFLLVTAGMYALYMVGIYSALTVVGFIGAIQLVVALIAGIFGVVSVKDYFAFKQGISFTISDSAKPGLYKRMREAAGKKALLPALGATVVLAVLVSLLETPCTAGFPVIWTGMLQANGAAPAEAVGLFILYMIPFLLDEFVIFGLAVYTMKAAKLNEKHAELLKLFGGVTMLALAAAIMINPAIMENPVAALILFAGAFALAAVIHLVTKRVRAARSTEVITSKE